MLEVGVAQFYGKASQETSIEIICIDRLLKLFTKAALAFNGLLRYKN